MVRLILLQSGIVKDTRNSQIFASCLGFSLLQDHPLLCRAGSALCLPNMWGSRALCWPGDCAEVLLPLHGGEPNGRKLLCLFASFHSSCCGLYHSNVLTPLLSQGGDLGSMTDANMPRLYLLQWLKSDRALMMLFNDGTFQVNTFTEI